MPDFTGEQQAAEGCQNSESPQRELGDCSDPTYKENRDEESESPQRELGDCSDPIYKGGLAESQIPPTAVGGLFRSSLRNKAIQTSQKRFQLHAPSVATKAGSEPSPNSRWGDSHSSSCFPCRLDLNHPPTSVGGIWSSLPMTACRRDLKNPPTAVGGISNLATGTTQAADGSPSPSASLAVCSHRRP